MEAPQLGGFAPTKPLSVAIHEGRILADIVARYGGLLQVGSQQRSDAKFIRACELVRNGRIGQLKTVVQTQLFDRIGDTPRLEQTVVASARTSGIGLRDVAWPRAVGTVPPGPSPL